MMMFLTILFASLIVLAINCLIFSTLAPQGAKPVEIRLEEGAALPSHFYVRPESDLGVRAPIPVELLRSQIERHVRLEQAAAETFLKVPVAETLHSRITSALMN